MLPEPGHIAPTLRLALILKSRGHRVEYLGTPGLEATTIRHGLGFKSVLPQLLDGLIGSQWMFETHRAGDQVYRQARTKLKDMNTSLELEIIRGLRESAPDLVLMDSALCSAWDAAESDHECFGARAIIRLSTSFTEENDPAQTPEMFRLLPELILCPQELDLPWSKPVKHERHFVEPSVFRKREEEDFPWDWLVSRRRLVYCSLGTQSGAYPTAKALLRRVVAAFRGTTDYQLIIGIGGHFAEHDFEDVPSNVLIRKRVPQLEILAKAAVLITHGGLGSIKEAILGAVPIVVLPFAHDQPLNAERVRCHRLGIALSREGIRSEEILEAVVDVVQDGTIYAKCKEFQTTFSNIEAKSPSVAHIERALHVAALAPPIAI